jgi:dTDP-4-amino-4,6-dideoxygalactose transaminase
MIPVMNVTRQYETISDELDQAALDVLHSGAYILGDKVSKFEKEFAAYCGANYGVGVGNGTDALVIALLACGVKKGDEGITSPTTFVATAEAIVQVGATPVFVDIDPETYTLDAHKLKDAFTNRTKAVIPVHIYGQTADMDETAALAHAHGAKVIEDCAQAAGATYKGAKAGSLGDVACVSFFPTKNLGAAGDGGMILTSDETIYRLCQAYRVHGSGMNGAMARAYARGEQFDETSIDFHGNLPKYYNYVCGFNSRLDALQAAILSVKLPYLDEWNNKRRAIAQRYSDEIQNELLFKPHVGPYNEHIYYVYPLKVKNRDKFRTYMEANDIATGVYFPVPMHLQECFRDLGYHIGDFPVAEELADTIVTLPMFPELKDEELAYIIEMVNRYEG